VQPRSKPRLVGSGPATFSTCRDLVRSPEWVADVNGYYRDLGVDPSATRGQIARAYRARGLNDAHLTFVVKQLLDPAIRQAYDRTPLGHVFLDEEVLDRVKKGLLAQVSEAPDTVSGIEWVEMTLDLLRVVDDGSWSEQDAPRTAGWPWSHYLWDTDQSAAGLLRSWQHSLVRTLSGAGERRQIAVGLMGGAHSEFEVVTVGGRTVFFIHEQSVSSTDALAQRAVSPTTRSSRGAPEMPASAPSFRKGAEEAREASKGAAFPKSHYFSLDGNPHSPNNSAILRFLTDKDDLIVVDQHNNIPTKGEPKDFEGSWPKAMSAVCRKDRAFEGMYDDCFICDHIVDGKKIKRPSGRSWALAVLREEVKEDGKIVGYRDATREVAELDDKGKPTGETHMEKAIVIVNMGYKNFFGILDGFGAHYGTLLDRDYKIRRQGTETDTTYQIVPLDPIEVDDDGTIFDLRDPQFMARYDAPDLVDLVAEKASDDFYARFFDTRVQAPSSKSSDSTPDAPERPSTEASSERMTALAQRVKGFGPNAAEAPSEAAKEEAPEETPAEAEEKAPEKPVAKKRSGMRQFD